MRRRNKPRVVWLPQTNANSVGDGTSSYQTFFVAASGVAGDTAVGEIPLVLDAQQSPLDTNDPSLSDIESSGYRLRRIVGKIYAQCAQSVKTADTDAVLSGLVTVGIMVRRASQSTGQSVGFIAGQVNIDPTIIDNTSDPWVWRRTWWLGNNGALLGLQSDDTALNPVPINNFGGYGSGIYDGPHIDQKTARIVGPEERLYLTAAVTILVPGSSSAAEPLVVGFVTDLRVLGSLRTTAGNRRNASR